MTTVLAHVERTARKPHHADCCGGTIESGARYIDQRCTDDGTAWAFRLHPLCFDLTHYIPDDDGELWPGYAEDELWELALGLTTALHGYVPSDDRESRNG